MRSRHNLLVLTCLLVTQAVLAGHLCTAGEKGFRSNPIEIDLLKSEGSKSDRLKLSLKANSSRVLTADREIPRALSSNPNVIKLVPLSPKKLQLSALQPGVTSVSIWQGNGDMQTVDVIVTADDGKLKLFLDRLYPDFKIEVVPLNSSVVLRGKVNDAHAAEAVVQIAEDFYPKVINQLSINEKTGDSFHFHVGSQRLGPTPTKVPAGGAPAKANLENEIRALRDEVGALRREIGQLTDTLKSLHSGGPAANPSDARALPRVPFHTQPEERAPVLSRGSERPIQGSEGRIGWPVPHANSSTVDRPPVELPHPTGKTPEVQVMLQARVFEIDEQTLQNKLSEGETGETDAAELVRAVVAGQLPEIKSVSAQLIEGNLVGAIDANSRQIGKWTRQLTDCGLAKVVAVPKLLTLSGQAASIQKGGEFPIIVPQGSGKVSVDYRSFGTKIEIKPVVIADQRIRLEVRPQFSDFDSDRSISVDGHVIPHLSTVQIDTAMELDAGQSLLIGGMPLGKKRHMVIVTPKILAATDLAARPVRSSPWEPRPGPGVIPVPSVRPKSK